MFKQQNNGKELTQQQKQQEDYYLHHQQLNSIQRQAYKTDITSVKAGTCVIVVDFKQDIIIGSGKRQRGSSFFDQIHRSVLAFVVYYYDTVQKKIQQRNYIYISSVLNKDATHVSHCMQQMIQTKWFISQKFTEVTLWCDTGPHFRCQQMAYFVLITLPKKFQVCS